MTDKKISQLTAATTPLDGTEVFPIVQSSTTKKASIANVQTAPIASGTANGVAYLNGSKVLTTGSALAFDGTYLGVGTSSPASKIHSYENNSSSGTDNGITIEQAGTGDAELQFLLTGVSRWAMGIDNSDSDSFKISTSSDIGTTPQITVTTTGNATINTGNLVIGTSGKGIDFSATANTGTSELLADYEEGTWTAVISGSSTAGTYELVTNDCLYTKTGRAVTLTAQIRFAGSITGGGSGSLSITGLPYTKAANQMAIGAVLLSGVDWTAGTNLSMAFSTDSASSTLRIAQTADNAGYTELDIAGVAAGDYIMFSITYFV